jgi:hypothetical protein
MRWALIVVLLLAGCPSPRPGEAVPYPRPATPNDGTSVPALNGVTIQPADGW